MSWLCEHEGLVVLLEQTPKLGGTQEKAAFDHSDSFQDVNNK